MPGARVRLRRGAPRVRSTSQFSMVPILTYGESRDFTRRPGCLRHPRTHGGYVPTSYVYVLRPTT
eukprot:6288233-Prymnesium_polylepis.2